VCVSCFVSEKLQWTGGAEGVRTPDLLNAIQALYQLSYDPVQSGDESKALAKIVKTNFWEFLGILSGAMQTLVPLIREDADAFDGCSLWVKSRAEDFNILALFSGFLGLASCFTGVMIPAFAE
jgi:hypothetical protein